MARRADREFEPTDALRRIPFVRVGNDLQAAVAVAFIAEGAVRHPESLALHHFVTALVARLCRYREAAVAQIVLAAIWPPHLISTPPRIKSLSSRAEQ